MTERKSLRLTEKEVNIITLALSNQMRKIDSHIETLRTINSWDESTDQNRKDLNDRMDDYFNAKELRSFLYGVFDDQ